jgi:hypothetical protein
MSLIDDLLGAVFDGPIETGVRATGSFLLRCATLGRWKPPADSFLVLIAGLTLWVAVIMVMAKVLIAVA